MATQQQVIPSLSDRLSDTDFAIELFHWQNLFYFAMTIIVLCISKFLYIIPIVLANPGRIRHVWSDFRLNQQLTYKDNKAVAMSFTGYSVAIGLIVRGAIVGERNDEEFGENVGSAILFMVIGFGLLTMSQMINDRVIFHQMLNLNSIMDHNLATGVVELGSYVSSGLIIGASVSGESSLPIADQIAQTIIFYFLGQAGMIIFTKLYHVLTPWKNQSEIKDKNVAAAIAYSSTIVALGVVISSSIGYTESLVVWVVWFVVGVVVLSVLRVLVDKLLLPTQSLNEEIVTDRNWGAALIEGSVAIGLAISTSTMLYETDCHVN